MNTSILKGQTMQLKDFLDMVNSLVLNQKVYFKPTTKENLNAYDPLIKHKIFELTIEPNGNYKVRYLTVMQELKFSKAELEKLFYDKSWQDFTIFDLVEDYNEWK